ncbi:unnamed protein product, partial [Agarophyton chilense]
MTGSCRLRARFRTHSVPLRCTSRCIVDSSPIPRRSGSSPQAAPALERREMPVTIEVEEVGDSKGIDTPAVMPLRSDWSRSTIPQRSVPARDRTPATVVPESMPVPATQFSPGTLADPYQRSGGLPSTTQTNWAHNLAFGAANRRSSQYGPFGITFDQVTNNDLLKHDRPLAVGNSSLPAALTRPQLDIYFGLSRWDCERLRSVQLLLKKRYQESQPRQGRLECYQSRQRHTPLRYFIPAMYPSDLPYVRIEPELDNYRRLVVQVCQYPSIPETYLPVSPDLVSLNRPSTTINWADRSRWGEDA